MTEPNSEIQREQQQLRQVIQEIEAQATKIESDNSYDGGSGVDAWADYCISKVIGNAEQRGSYLRRHLEKPYYSRLTFVDEGQVNDVYLGRYAGVYGGARLLDWRAPVAALMQPHTSRLQTYHVPTGATVTHRHVFLQRKRALDIATRNVHKINDLVEYTEAGPGNEEEFFHFSKLNETFLLSRLEAGSEAALKDIVETIQTEQDALIRASLNHPLIVNGVPGSGKTSVAFHRIALLLYPEYAHDLDPTQIMVFAPNAFSLGYLKEILPGLGVRGVQQRTFAEWMFSQLGWEGGSVQDVTLDIAASSSHTLEEKRAAWVKAQTRSSDRVLDVCRQHLLSRTVERLGSEDLHWEIEIGTEILKVKLERTVLVAFLNDHLADGMERARTAFAEFLSVYVREQLQQVHNISPRRFSRGLTKQIEYEQERLVRKVFPATDYKKEATALFGKLKQLEVACQGIFTPQEIPALHLEKLNFKDLNTVDITVLPMFMAMHVALQPPQKKLDYVVVDEGQDVSLLLYRILEGYTRPGRISIFGDLLQGIHGYRGIRSWEPVLERFRTTPDDQLKFLQRTYRSTREIVDLANAIIRPFAKDAAYVAQSVGRSGVQPTIRPYRDLTDLSHQIIPLIEDALDRGWNNIGIVTKFSDSAKNLRSAIKACKPTFEVYGEGTTVYSGGVAVIPADIAKGLEFDAVLLIDVDDVTYHSNIEYDARVLFVAVTRGLHQVAMFVQEGKTVTSLLNSVPVL